MDWKDVPALSEATMPGIVGAIVSLRWIPGTWPVRLTMVLGGAAAGHWGAGLVADLLGMSGYLGGVGFLLGLFSMAIVGKMIDGLLALDPNTLIGAAVDRVFGRRS